MKLHQTWNTERVQFLCKRPPDDIKYGVFVIEQSEDEHCSMTEVEYRREVRRLVEEKVNPNGFWDEVEITLAIPVGDSFTGRDVVVKI